MSDIELSSIAENIKDIFNSINDILEQSSAYKQKVSIIAVTKKQSKENIVRAIQSGIVHFGENYVQEAHNKWLDIKKEYPFIKLHFIGTLQKNKIKKALELFDYIHTIDSIELLDRVVQYDNHKLISYFVQVNVDKNKSAGCKDDDLPIIIEYCRKYQLDLKGLMAVLPRHNTNNPNSVHSSAYFAYLKQLSIQYNLLDLSMGMSDDYKDAVKFGSTFVRLGRIIFNN